MDKLGYYIITVVLSCMFILAVTSSITRNYDDSDPPDGRSGFEILTDYRTGCQYLRYPGTGLAPRMDRNGQQICERATQ